MTGGEMADAIDALVPVGERGECVVELSHTDEGASMRGIALLTHCRLTISPSGETVLLLGTTVGWTGEETEWIDETSVMRSSEAMRVSDLVSLLRCAPGRRVFHTLDDPRRTPSFFASLSRLGHHGGSIPAYCPAGQRESLLDEEAVFDAPPVLSVWNAGEPFVVE